MAITKKTILDQVEVTRNGDIQLRIALVIDDDGVELSSKWHRTSIPAGTSVADQIAAVNTHLDRNEPGLGAWPALTAEAVAYVESIVERAWTPALLAKAEERKSEQKATPGA